MQKLLPKQKDKIKYSVFIYHYVQCQFHNFAMAETRMSNTNSVTKKVDLLSRVLNPT